jgi:hypothetical protein
MHVSKSTQYQDHADMNFFLSTQYQDQVAMFKSRCQTTTGRCVWMVSTQLTIVVSYGTRIHELKTSFLSTHHPFIHPSIHPSIHPAWCVGWAVVDFGPSIVMPAEHL